MAKLPQVYHPGTDKLVNVTQEWCDSSQKALNKLAKQRNIIRSISNLNSAIDVEKLDKIGEFLNSIGMDW